MGFPVAVRGNKMTDRVPIGGFPSDIKGCMKDCIMAVLWPRKDIYSFFKDHGCTKHELDQIANFQQHGLSRKAMVNLVFELLDSRTDNGLGPFRAMLKSLVDWHHFDPYYFDKLRKLDRENARHQIAHLRQLQELRDSKIKGDRQRREELQGRKQVPKKTLCDLRDEFLNLHAGSLEPRKRGYALERILIELARTDSLEVTEPFRVQGEQIDGAIKYDGEHYLIEAKWQDALSANESVYQFVGKIEGKMYGRGLFVSVQGFSNNVINTVVKGKAIKTIFIDGEDLVLVLEEHLSLLDMIDAKVKSAQTRGLIYSHPISGVQKAGLL